MSLPEGIPPPPTADAPALMHTVLDASGEILRVVSFSDDEQRAANTPIVGSVVLGPPPSMAHYRSAGAWVAKAARPSKSHQWDAVNKGWVDPRTLAEVVGQANAAIDAAAGAARQRYISDVAGQSAVYMRKADQAAEYVAAGYTGTVPPYIAAEATARGMTATELADEVLEVADLWDTEVGPAIEAQRVAGKKAVAAAANPAAALVQMQAALDALGAL